MRARWPYDLYVITDPSSPRGADPYLEALGASGDLGSAPRLALQLRDKTSPDADVRELVGLLAQAANPGGAPLLVSASSPARVALARDPRVGGVHLPELAPAVDEVRRLVERELWVGASVHDASGVIRRCREGADFLVLGPIGPVPGKGEPLAFEELRQLVELAGAVPVLALGGVRGAEDVARALEAGCAGIAVMSALTRAADGAEVVGQMARWLDEGRATETARSFRDLPGRSR